MTKGDLTRARWARTLARLRRNMAELREYDVQVIEPPNMDTPPALRTPQ
jgi:hypothetical protein